MDQKLRMSSLPKNQGSCSKKRSVFLYRKDFHELRQNRGEDPERYAARIKQLAPACTFVSDNNTPRYGPDVMSTQFVLGLDDVYTMEQLYQMKPEPGKTTVSFERLVDAASEIAVAKDNVAEASGSASMCAMSLGDKSKATCWYCNSNSHNENRFSEEVCRKFCKAFGKRCEKCGRDNHTSAACRADQIKKRREDKAKKATVKEVSAVEEKLAVAAAPAAAAPSAVSNSVQAGVPAQQPASQLRV